MATNEPIVDVTNNMIDNMSASAFVVAGFEFNIDASQALSKMMVKEIDKAILENRSPRPYSIGMDVSIDGTDKSATSHIIKP